MPTFLKLLESFNRKERFFLVGQALGNPKFQLSDGFRSMLGGQDAFGIVPPKDALVFMDYHLDWLHASLFLSLPENDVNGIHPNSRNVATGTQEDIDLLIAFQYESNIHVLLIEAKGATRWNNRQLTSKAEKFRNIFGECPEKEYPGIVPHFCLMSPKQVPQSIKSTEWPEWMTNNDNKPIWLRLDIPTDRRKVTRCDENGNPQAHALIGSGYFNGRQLPDK